MMEKVKRKNKTLKLIFLLTKNLPTWLMMIWKYLVLWINRIKTYIVDLRSSTTGG